MMAAAITIAHAIDTWATPHGMPHWVAGAILVVLAWVVTGSVFRRRWLSLLATAAALFVALHM
jgi:hypothetical protein